MKRFELNIPEWGNHVYYEAEDIPSAVAELRKDVEAAFGYRPCITDGGRTRWHYSNGRRVFQGDPEFFTDVWIANPNWEQALTEVDNG